MRMDDRTRRLRLINRAAGLRAHQRGLFMLGATHRPASAPGEDVGAAIVLGAISDVVDLGIDPAIASIGWGVPIRELALELACNRAQDAAERGRDLDAATNAFARVHRIFVPTLRERIMRDEDGLPEDFLKAWRVCCRRYHERAAQDFPATVERQHRIGAGCT